jgi:hypothetical protein
MCRLPSNTDVDLCQIAVHLERLYAYTDVIGSDKNPSVLADREQCDGGFTNLTCMSFQH